LFIQTVLRDRWYTLAIKKGLLSKPVISKHYKRYFLPPLILTSLGSELPDEIDFMCNFNMNHFGKIINCETPKKEKPS